MLNIVEDKEEFESLLDAWQEGDKEALNQLMPLVIDDVYMMASNRFGRERTNHTLQPTALVNELYLRLVQHRGVPPKSKLHFYATAALTIKCILIDHARHKNALKVCPVVAWSNKEDLTSSETDDHLFDDLVALDQALAHLEQADAELGRIVHLRFFLGLTYEEIAALVERSQKWVRRRWELARAILLLDLAPDKVLA